MDKSELRQDPLTHEWTIFSESRALPPESGPVTADVFDPSPLKAGFERFAPHSLFQSGADGGWQVRVVPNRIPLLRVEAGHEQKTGGLFRHLDGLGAHEIIVEDPGDRRLDELPPKDIAQVIAAWKARIEDLTRDSRLRAFAIVKNAGRAAGQTIAQSVSQLISLAIVPEPLRRKTGIFRAHFAEQQRPLLAELLAAEREQKVRIVYENDGFAVLCPWASTVPFELAMWPTRHCADFHRITAPEIEQLADALWHALARLNRALGEPPYHLTLTTAPLPHDDEAAFCWHISIRPRLRPESALESLCHVNGVWPEVAADFLRRQEVRP